MPADTLASLRDEVERRVFGLPGWMGCTFVWPRPCDDGHTKSALRPVLLQGKPAFQDTRTGGRSADTRNYSRNRAKELVRSMLESDFSEVHVQSADGDLHARVTKKGHVLVSRSRALKREASSATAHDHTKDYPLQRFDSAALLQALGFAGPDGRLLPSMHGKYRQVNEFLRALEATLEEVGVDPSPQLRLVDVGCGRTYLSFSARAYLAQRFGCDTELTGVEIRDDIVATCRATAERLDLAPPAAEFVAQDIAAYTPAHTPDVVFSLHACDTATDLALARGVQWGARAIVSAPCCQHEIQKTLRTDGPSRALLRHGILRERLADLLADALRAQILRILGYRVRVVEFVEPEATGRNVMLRAVKGIRPGAAEAVAEYLALRDEWKVVPPLETFLAAELARVGVPLAAPAPSPR